MKYSDELFEQLGRLTPESIIIHRDETIIYANQSSVDLLGASDLSDVMGRRMEDFVPLGGRERVAARRALLSQGKEPEPEEFELLGLDGRSRTAFVSSGCVRFDGECARLVVARDVTARRDAEAQSERLEAQLNAAQRLEAIGRLAGGIAHDFNNLLTVIGGYTKLALEDLSDPDALRHRLTQIDQAAERAAALTRQLLAFGRQQILRPSLLKLNAIVVDLEKMLQRLIGEDVSLVLDLEPDLCGVNADRGQIEQVIVNLVMNARDAMPEGGKIVLSTAYAKEDSVPAGQEAPQPSDCYTVLCVTDEGAGMDRETVARIFEPFFTTKGPGGGTGLGLATVYGIVRQSQGAIEVDSEVGRGTTFRVYLPTTKTARGVPTDPALSQSPVAEDGEVPNEPSAVVLLVEDDPQVRALGERILGRAGFHVIVAEDAERGLELALENAGRLDLLVTDVVLPGRDGPHLANRVAEVAPAAKVLFISGYTEERLGTRGVLGPGVELLEKPFTPSVLLSRVRGLLHGLE